MTGNPQRESSPAAATADEPSADDNLAKAAAPVVSAKPATGNPLEYAATPSARRRSAVRLLAARLFARTQR